MLLSLSSFATFPTTHRWVDVGLENMCMAVRTGLKQRAYVMVAVLILRHSEQVRP